jgi:hypothetical protein
METCVSCLNLVLEILRIVLYNVLDRFFVPYTIFFTARTEEQQSFWQALMVPTECKKQLRHPDVISLYSRLLLSLFSYPCPIQRW